MANKKLVFEWEVCLDGYRIIDALAPIKAQQEQMAFFTQRLSPEFQPFLRDFQPGTIRVVVPNSDRMTVYDPTDEEHYMLFFRFAELSSEDSITDFANRYGLLGRQTEFQILDRFEKHEDHLEYESHTVLGESIVDWCNQEELLHKSLLVWLSEHDSDDALEHLARQFNYWLSSQQAEWIFRRTAKDGLIPRLRPRNLLGAMWVQLYEAMRNHRRFQPCPVCGRHFEQIPTEKGKHGKRPRVYCSDPCKHKAFRKKRKEMQT